MKLLDARAIPVPRVWSGHTDTDLMKEVRHYFPTPGPLLKELFDRFESGVTPEQSEVDPAVGYPIAECPACGTALKLDHP
jgi:hypothetical protein